MILKHVDDIRHLIDEFSSFARLPKPKLLNLDIQKFISESFVFFKTSYPNIKFNLQNDITNKDKLLFMQMKNN